MSEPRKHKDPLPWHIGFAEALDEFWKKQIINDRPQAQHGVWIQVVAQLAAAHDPSAELLRECAKALQAIIDGCNEARAEAEHEARLYGGGRASHITYVGEPEARAALARLAEAGVVVR